MKAFEYTAACKSLELKYTHIVFKFMSQLNYQVQEAELENKRSEACVTPEDTLMVTYNQKWGNDE